MELRLKHGSVRSAVSIENKAAERIEHWGISTEHTSGGKPIDIGFPPF